MGSGSNIVGAFSSDSTLTTPVAINKGGTGQTTQQTAIDALTDVSSATTSDVLTKDGSGNATFQAAAGGGAWTLISEITNGDAADLVIGAIGSAVFSGYNWIRVLLSTTSTGSGDYGNINFFNNTAQINTGVYNSQGLFGSRVVAIAYTTEASLSWMPLFFSDGTPTSAVGLDLTFNCVSNGLGANNFVAFQKSNSNGGNGNAVEINSSACTFTSSSALAGLTFVQGASGNALTPAAGTVNISVFGS